jgi:two-component system sensor kinase FixL
MLAEKPAPADPRLADTLNKASKEALRAAAVLQRLREFYRGEGARLELTDPLSVCARVAAMLRDRMGRSAVEFELQARESLSRVMIDRTQLEIVVHNLLSNSLDALDTLDALPPPRVQRRRIEVSAVQAGPDVLIAVDDSGPGVAASVTARLFEPFVTSKASGMGLGLSLSRTLLRHQGGDLHCEPSHLGGARFVIRLTTRSNGRTSL